jgi:hypothetical protein
LKNNLIFIGCANVPQEALRVFLVDKRHKRAAVFAPRCVQLDYMAAAINATLE